jgi:two-component sensor histidine kinase
METLVRLLPGPQPAVIRYGATAGIVLLALALRLGMGEGTGRFGFIHFILPIMAAALLFDRNAGFFAVALSATLVGSILSWERSAIGGNVSAIGYFVIVGVCLALVANGLHTALLKAHAAQRATDLLLQELSHRVKNKFAMISSIIALQSRASTPEVSAALQDIAARVNVISTVHNYLQVSRYDGHIDMSEYLPKLCNALSEALRGARPIAVRAKADIELLAPDKALAVGVIANELVTNAFKYAFEEDQVGHVVVELTRQGGELELSVSDDGMGCSKGRQPGLGTRLVSVFAAQLGGSAHWDDRPQGGCEARVRFAI